MALRQEEIKALNKATISERYFYTLSVMVDEGWTWSISADNDWMWIPIEEGQQMIPIWPHEEMALACAPEGMEVHPISFDDWMAHWIPRLQTTGELVIVYPGPDIQGLVTSGEGMAADIVGEQAIRDNPQQVQEFVQAVAQRESAEAQQQQPSPMPLLAAPAEPVTESEPAGPGPGVVDPHVEPFDPTDDEDDFQQGPPSLL